jgi:hypothetical protein
MKNIKSVIFSGIIKYVIFFGVLTLLILPNFNVNIAVATIPVVSWYSPYNNTINQDIFPTIGSNITCGGEAFAVHWYNYEPTSPTNWNEFDLDLTDDLYPALAIIDHNYIPETFVNFPILIDNTSTFFLDTSHGGSFESDASDIEFWSADNSTQYHHEVEYYDGSTGKLVVWINISSLSSLVDTRIYIRSNGTTGNKNHSKVWDSDYAAVYHMNATDGENYIPLYDSTENHFSLSPVMDAIGPGTSPGVVGYSVSMLGDHFKDNTSSLQNYLRNESTVEFWARSDAVDGNYRYIFSTYKSAAGSQRAEAYVSTGGTTVPLRFDYVDDDDDGIYTRYGIHGGDNFWDNQWNYFALTRYNRTHTRLQYNMSYNVSWNRTDDMPNMDTDLNFTSANQFVIGARYDNPLSAMHFTGQLDEFRISKIARSSNWLNMTYQFAVNSTKIVQIFLPVSTPYANVSKTLMNATALDSEYQWRVHTVNASGQWTNNTYTFSTFALTAPSNVGIAAVNSTAVNVTWDDFKTASGFSHLTGNVSNIVRYSSTGYPTALDEGVAAYNGSADYTIVSGLTIDTTYYFSVWHRYEKYGVAYYSDTYAGDNLKLIGGVYQITIYFENNCSLLDNMDKLYNSSLVATAWSGTQVSYNDSFTTNPFTILIDNANPIIFSFNYNNSGLIRSVTPAHGVTDIDFYISDEPLYDANTTDYHNYQFWYKFGFADNTPLQSFVNSLETKFYIYLYNQTNGKYYVHQDFLSASKTVVAPLEYGKRYYLAIENNKSFIPFLQYIDTSASLEYVGDDAIVIYAEGEDYNYFHYLANINVSRLSNRLYVNYSDITKQTYNVTVYFYQYYKNNQTKALVNVSFKTYGGSNLSFSFLKTILGGFNETADYLIEVKVNHSYFDAVQNLVGASYYLPIQQWDRDDIEAMFMRFLPRHPMYPSVGWFETFLASLFIVMMVFIGDVSTKEIGCIVASVIVLFIDLLAIVGNTGTRTAIALAMLTLLVTSVVRFITQGEQRGGYL